MKKLFSWASIASLLFAMPSISIAGGKNDKLAFGGTVTAVTDATITVAHEKTSNGVSKTIKVPADTKIADENGTSVALADLVGKHVKVTESSEDTAQSILVNGHGAKKTP